MKIFLDGNTLQILSPRTISQCELLLFPRIHSPEDTDKNQFVSLLFNHSVTDKSGGNQKVNFNMLGQITHISNGGVYCLIGSNNSLEKLIFPLLSVQPLINYLGRREKEQSLVMNFNQERLSFKPSSLQLTADTLRSKILFKYVICMLQSIAGYTPLNLIGILWWLLSVCFPILQI